MALKLELFTRSGCHLCEEMEQEIAVLQVKLGFTTNIIEINENLQLEKLYGDKVPVLAYDNNIICMYIIDEDALRDTLKHYS